MSKRPIEDVDADATVAANGTSIKKKKKDKTDRKSKANAVENRTAVSADGEEVKVKRKKEKKDKNRKKEEKKRKEDPIAGNPQAEEDEVEEDAMDVNKVVEQKPSREERRAAKKAAKKAAKEAKKGAKIPNRNISSNGATSSETIPAPTTYSTPSGPPRTTSGYTESPELTCLPKATIGEFLTTHSISITDPWGSNLRPITSFSYLPPHSFDFSAFTTPTPIQAATWPFMLSGNDCIGVAETGSGKTLAFAIPAIRHIVALKASQKGSRGVRALVVSPTRELAMQIFDSMEKFSKEAKLGVVCVYGGVSKDEQRQKLKRADIVVATPGRLNDLINEGSADLSKVSYLVLDEADRMLDKGKDWLGVI